MYNRRIFYIPSRDIIKIFHQVYSLYRYKFKFTFTLLLKKKKNENVVHKTKFKTFSGLNLKVHFK